MSGCGCFAGCFPDEEDEWLLLPILLLRSDDDKPFPGVDRIRPKALFRKLFKLAKPPPTPTAAPVPLPVLLGACRLLLVVVVAIVVVATLLLLLLLLVESAVEEAVAVTEGGCDGVLLLKEELVPCTEEDPATFVAESPLALLPPPPTKRNGFRFTQLPIPLTPTPLVVVEVVEGDSTVLLDCESVVVVFVAVVV